MIIQDPAGVLQRIPELKPLCEDAGVRRAVERGDPFRLYRALFWARWLGRLRSHRAVLDALLRQRRLFARPLKGSPSLGTVNGFGMTLLGSAEPDPEDGTSIATHCFVALFAIPLLPLGAYVVRPSEENKGLQRGWTLFARVPMGAFPWLYGRAVALGVMALVGLGAARAFHASRYQDVRVVNGFQEPLRVEIGGLTQLVPAGGMHVLSVPVGAQKGRAVSEGGVEVDTVEINVASGHDVLAWNIAGAAPIFRETVTYQKVLSQAPSPYKPTFFCGERVVVLDNVNDAFVQPPSSVQMSKHQASVSRTHVDVVRERRNALELCMAVLQMEERFGDALPFTEAVARLANWEDGPATLAVQVAFAKTPAEAIRVARRALEARPDSVELHRTYQWARENAGELSALREEYRPRAEAQPDSATAQYLYRRLLRGPEGLSAMEELAQRFPDDPHILRAAVYNRWRAGDWEGTVKGWEQLRGLDLMSAVDLAKAEATALVALGRRGEALKLLRELFQAESSEQDSLAELYARVAHVEKGESPDTLITALEASSQLEEGEKLWDLRARSELPLVGAPEGVAARLVYMVKQDPQAALKLAERLKRTEIRWLNQGTWGLTYGEAVRTGATVVEQVLGRTTGMNPDSQELFRRFVRGEAVRLEEAELDPELRAAACFVRSRNATLPAEERQKLVEQARREDWFQGTVTEAIATWAP
ncbi:hypothetical protein [Hyalangium rubrum]|uniref:Uncharacterized protein n=1 Tax=Hyalangium rubrum TaxID=3103134 RepID=A0ABU5HJE4_9BACT|nr:hypothetical protein [Hyalangium sp. s54d21]MDY7232947.1 hypothetical protein [Hyalangium sp. s54d21]